MSLVCAVEVGTSVTSISDHTGVVRGRGSAQERLKGLLRGFYQLADCDTLSRDLLSQAFRPSGNGHRVRWDESTSVLITYADTIQEPGHASLEMLHRFLEGACGDMFTVLHVLPFLQATSDGGFAVCSHECLDSRFGTWGHLDLLARKRLLMADLVLNHVSASHPWVQQFRRGELPGATMVMAPERLSGWEQVVRPRSSALFTPVETCNGLRAVWTTFGPDQVDLDWRNPAVLEAFTALLDRFVQHGVAWIRMDAVGFIWKRNGTPCIHLPETHDLVRSFRVLLEQRLAHGVLLTETNVPQQENLSYLDSGDEAHMAYNFPLPPLLLEAMVSGHGDLLNHWLARWPDLPAGTTLLNFSACHDGVGLRPLEGLMETDRLLALLRTCEERGGLVSHRSHPDGSSSPYEITITWWSAMASSSQQPSHLQLERFLCSQLLVMALPGIPAFYLPALLTSENDRETYARTGHRRDLNRERFRFAALMDRIRNPESSPARVLAALRRALQERCRCAAFHPEAPLKLLSERRSDLVALRRGVGAEAVVAVHSLAPDTIHLPWQQLGLDGEYSGPGWLDRLSKRIHRADHPLDIPPYGVLWLQRLPN